MRHSTAMVNELNAAKRLILKHFELVIESLMHISGLIQYMQSKIFSTHLIPDFTPTEESDSELIRQHLFLDHPLN